MSFAQDKARMKRILKACDAPAHIVADFDDICRYRTKEPAEELLLSICRRHNFVAPYQREGEGVSFRPCAIGPRHPDHRDDTMSDDAEAEQCYRRGFHQGADQILHMVKEGKPLDVIAARVEAIRSWRQQPIQRRSYPAHPMPQELPARWDHF